jgi:hypothetical protein
LKIQDQDDPRAVREKVTGKLLTLDEALKPTVPAFQALLDVPADDAAWSALDPPHRRQRTLEAVKRLLLRESQVQPLLVIFASDVSRPVMPSASSCVLERLGVTASSVARWEQGVMGIRETAARLLLLLDQTAASQRRRSRRGGR